MKNKKISNSVLTYALGVKKCLDRVKAFDEDMFWYDLYVNGRERGFAVVGISPDAKNTRFYCAFSENRNSDDLVVYCAVVDTNTYITMSHDNFIPTDEIYRKAKYFRMNFKRPTDTYNEVAEYIIAAMNKFMITDWS